MLKDCSHPKVAGDGAFSVATPNLSGTSTNQLSQFVFLDRQYDYADDVLFLVFVNAFVFPVLFIFAFFVFT